MVRSIISISLDLATGCRRDMQLSLTLPLLAGAPPPPCLLLL